MDIVGANSWHKSTTSRIWQECSNMARMDFKSTHESKKQKVLEVYFSYYCFKWCLYTTVVSPYLTLHQTTLFFYSYLHFSTIWKPWHVGPSVLKFILARKEYSTTLCYCLVKSSTSVSLWYEERFLLRNNNLVGVVIGETSYLE